MNWFQEDSYTQKAMQQPSHAGRARTRAFIGQLVAREMATV